MRPEALQSLLRDTNPFASNAAGEPWSGEPSDVPAINHATFAGITALVRQQGRTPGTPLAVLVQGDVGHGKTHLIGRLRQTGLHADLPFALAYVQPVEATRHPFRHLLRELVVSLRHPLTPDEPRCELHRLAAFLLAGKDKERTLPTAAALTRQVRKNGEALLERLRGLFPGLHAPTVKALLLAVDTGPERLSALEWLQGEVVEPVGKLCGKAFDRSRLDDATLEEEARRVLITLGLLAGHARLPILIGFDRLENLTSREQVHAFEKMLELLVDKITATLPMVFVRNQQWVERLREELNQQVRTRLEGNTFELTGCSREEAEQLVERRLISVLGEKERALLPLSADQLLIHLVPGRNAPRTVITLANHALREWLQQPPQPEATPRERLRQELKQRYQDLLSRMDHQPGDPARLLRALRLLMEQKPGIAGVESGESGELLCLDSAGQAIELYQVDGENHHLRVINTLKRAMAWGREHADSRVHYVREERYPIRATWKATLELLEKFKQQGHCRVLTLDRSRAARWYALADLSYALGEKEITVSDTPGRERAVTLAELAAFIREVLLSPEKVSEMFPPLATAGEVPPPATVKKKPVAPPPGKNVTSAAIDPLTLVKQVCGVLRQAPAHLLTVEKLLDHLPGLTEAELLHHVGNHPEHFTTLPSQGNLLIHLRPYHVHHAD